MPAQHFPFQPGDKIVSRGVEHWTNSEPLKLVATSHQTFIGESASGDLFQYHQGNSQRTGIFWISVETAEQIARLDALTGDGDIERDHSEADDILLASVDPLIATAYRRLVERSRWWACA